MKDIFYIYRQKATTDDFAHLVVRIFVLSFRDVSVPRARKAKKGDDRIKIACLGGDGRHRSREENDRVLFSWYYFAVGFVVDSVTGCGKIIF